MHNVRRLAAPAVLAFAALLSALSTGCSPKSAKDLGHKLVVHGVVTDAALMTTLKGVKVTLLSSDNFSPVTTNDQGYFQFVNVLQIDNVLVQFQFDGYATVTIPVNPTVLNSGGFSGVDGGVPNFPGFGDDVDGFDASIALSQLVLVPVAGTVYDGTNLALGASVLLSTPDGVVGYQTKTDAATGRFSFPGVRIGSWTLSVLPYDRDADGLSDTQFFSQSYSVAAASAANLGNLVVVLKDVQRALVASSFSSLSAAYPISAGTLLGGVTGVLPAPGTTVFLHFGAEVDPLLTSFELVQVEPGPRYSAPIGVTVAWDKASVAKITAASPLVASDDSSIGYELRVRALRFKDGTPGINPSGSSYGTIAFSVLALPVALPSIAPSIYFASKFTSTQSTASAVVDQSTIWLLDGNGDFVFDTVPGANYNNATGMLLSWNHTPGAVRYHVMARNTTSAGGNATAALDWRELGFVGAPDPTVNTQVVASVNPWTGGSSGVPLGSGGAPWAFNNHVQFTVVSEDAIGFRSPIDPGKVLDTSDTFGGLITGIEVDPALGFPFNNSSERGATFNKAIRVSFSEPMTTTSVPTLTSGSANLTIKKVLATAWGTGAQSPSATPLNTSQHAFFDAQLQIKGACTELMVDRSVGDTLLPVRDASLFAVAAGGRVLFLSIGGGFLGESVGITAVDAATNRVTLTTALVPNVSAGSLVCSLQAPGTVTAFVSTNATSVTVADPSAFYVGETVMVYEPQVNGAGQIVDTRTVTGVDTVAKVLLLNAALTAGHTSATVVVPLNVLGAEFSLRSSVALALQKDALGGTAAELFFTGPANVLVGDLLQVDADGDLKTTTDQAVVTVKQVKFAPTGAPATYSLIVDLPATMSLLHGKSTFRAMGDSFQVGGTKDTSGGTKALDPHRDQFSTDAVLF
jgi:hypothetical protein